ncbi:unnamed protein product [Protopolystoma xenopodis]|uniref:Uncharacterized protein n=1 Tax=Protopolystoma xenopodis TaxID=117903 RepID=A0A3S5BVG0_9PLAT|nr:unnamed protein product [Protopolystoma xenopodis]
MVQVVILGKQDSIDSSYPSVNIEDNIAYNDSENGLIPISETTTDALGNFQAGPIPLAIGALPPDTRDFKFDIRNHFSVRLSKPAYEFSLETLNGRIQNQTNLSSVSWSFKAKKLAFLQIKVTTIVENAEAPLSGVLLSVIGDDYRKNKITNLEGYTYFVGLSPALRYIAIASCPLILYPACTH